MIICKTKAEIRDLLKPVENTQEKIALVPTMGALHEGHLSLIEKAREESDRVVATIFVNPLQFGPTEDFDTYPRQFEEDRAKLEEAGCDYVFAPERSSLFPDDFSTHVSVTQLTENHCGAVRPQFFGGIATIVTKLLLIVRPTIAVFGEKDYQQLTMIRRMVRDLDIDVDIIGGPTVREEDGLAMSSRNNYLTPKMRSIAPALYRILSRASLQASEGGQPWSVIRGNACADLLNMGFESIDYFDLVDAQTLAMLTQAQGPARILAAARIGQAETEVRLIDNVSVDA